MNALVISNREIDNATYFKDPEMLDNFLKTCPDYDTLIFSFWSYIVPSQMLGSYRCYGLHTGPLLEGVGKGGSPIDNLKALGVRMATVCAFEMTEKVDEGRVICAVPIYLDGSKADIIAEIDALLPVIVDYITMPKVLIPERFKRMNV